MMAKHSFLPPPCSVREYSSSFHFFRRVSGSFSHGLTDVTACMKILTPVRLLDRGPNTPRIESWPSIEPTVPADGIRPYDGRRPYRPFKWDGIRMELITQQSVRALQDTIKDTYPPISEPTPRGLPFMPISAPSPPEEPPHVSERL